MTTTAQLDKSVGTTFAEGYGTITIRVVVLKKGMAAAPAPQKGDESPVDAAPDEVLPDTDKRPNSTFLEEPKRGRQCCVFLINGQRQHAWDNHFIVRDLELKYLRNRMIVVVDCDGLKPEAIAHLMQGSRHQFFDGEVYSALEARVIATLKGDPDLRRLEEEEEEEISSLQAGDEAVKAALDQLIEAHHEAASHAAHGQDQGGEATRSEGTSGTLIQTEQVVVEANAATGTAATEPTLSIRPDIAVLRLKPNESRRCFLFSKPEATWKAKESLVLTLDPPVKELLITRISQYGGEDVALKFVEGEGFDEDEYPVETTLRCITTFKGLAEPRLLERRVVVTPARTRIIDPPPPKPELKDDPTFLKVTSRQPIKILVGGPDAFL
jgi:hypothetical protein